MTESIRPPVGTHVRLTRDDRFLQLYHDAHPGTIGVIVRHSALGKDDNGVLVDWGDGHPVRTDADEFDVTSDTQPAPRDDRHDELDRLRHRAKTFHTLDGTELRTLALDALALAERTLIPAGQEK